VKTWLQELLRALEGQSEAFGAVVREFQDMAVGYAYSLLRNFEQAEDAAQEAFVEAYRTLAKLRQPEAFPGWFRRIVFKHCDRILRRKCVPAVALDDANEVASATPRPDEISARKEIQEKVLETIEALPEDERAVTSLFYINGYTADAVGQFLDLPVSTVRGRLHAARNKLREQMMSIPACLYFGLSYHAIPVVGRGYRVVRLDHEEFAVGPVAKDEIPHQPDVAFESEELLAFRLRLAFAGGRKSQEPGLRDVDEDNLPVLFRRLGLGVQRFPDKRRVLFAILLDVLSIGGVEP